MVVFYVREQESNMILYLILLSGVDQARPDQIRLNYTFSVYDGL